MSGHEQDFDLNLAPIIDCFTVLITFMLVSASFLALGIYETGVSAAAVSTTNAKKPSITLEVELIEKNTYHLKVSGKERSDKNIPAANGDWDLASLKLAVGAIKKKWPDTESLILSAKNDIEYLNIIRTMEVLRQTIPSVLLGGF